MIYFFSLTITTPESTLDSQVNITNTASVLSLITAQYPISTSTTISVSSTTCSTGCFNSFSSSSASTCLVQAATFSSVNYFMDPINAIDLPTNSHVVKSLTYSCANYPGIDIAYTFTTDKGNPIPSWISFDMNGGTIIYDTPNVITDQNYEFDIKVTNDHDTKVEYIKVYVTVKAPSSTSTSSSASTTSSTSNTSSSSVSCKVQNCNTCKTNHSDRWSVWNTGYIVYSNLDLWESTQTSRFNNMSEFITIANIVSTFILEISMVAINFSSPQGLWAVLNHYQLLMLLLLTGAYFPKEIADFFAGIKQVSFNFGFLPKINYPNSKSDPSWFDFQIDNYYLEVIGMNSGSSIINILNIIYVVIFNIFLHLLFLLIYFLTKNIRKDEGKCKKVTSYWVRYFTLCVYLRLILQSNQFLLICSAYEINLFGTKTLNRFISFIIAAIIYVFWIKITLISILKAFQARIPSINIHNKIFEEFFAGIKDSKLSKYYTSMLMIRRAIFVSFLIFWDSLNFYIKIGVLDLIQALCIIYLIYTRPFKNSKISIINIINDIEFIGLCSLLFKFNKQSDWTQTIKYVFTGTIGGTGLIVVFILLCNLTF